MRIKLLISMGGVDFSHHAGDEIEANDLEALRLIDAGFAEAKNKKAYEDLKAKIEADEVEKVEKEKEIEAILYKDELLAEKTNLLKRVSDIDAILGTEGK